MADLPDFAWPLQFQELADGSVVFAEVEQTSTAGHMAAAALIAATPRGRRIDQPGFGVTQLLFQQGPLDVDRLATEISAADPRLDLDADEVLDLADAARRQVSVHVD